MTDSVHGESIRIEAARLEGQLAVPAGAVALVLMLQGTGRMPQSHAAMGQAFRAGGLGTLMLDIVGDPGAIRHRGSLGIELLVARIVQTLDWVAERPALAGLRVGVLAGGIGAAAVLRAASLFPGRIGSVVVHSGRLDLLHEDVLACVLAPTLLIVGGDDHELQRINRHAIGRMTCVRRLEVLPHTGHWFEAPGALDTVAHLARAWFQHRLGGPWLN